jgi:GNAT superfamily N-acetyltransferase
MHYREAQPADIPAMSAVRLAVTENVLSNPARITPADYADYTFQRGRGWVAEAEGRVVGFAVADLLGHNIWALFVHPDYAGRGIGKRLHERMLTWYFTQTAETVWLSTAPGTRAEEFYRRQGWQDTGRTGSGEVRFELTAATWAANPGDV